MKLNKLQEMVKDRGAWPAGLHGVINRWTRLSNSTANLLLTKKRKRTRYFFQFVEVGEPSKNTGNVLTLQVGVNGE